jgi:hypothetical protein
MKAAGISACLMVVALCISSTACAQQKVVWFHYGKPSMPDNSMPVTIMNDAPHTVRVKYAETTIPTTGAATVLVKSMTVVGNGRRYLGSTCARKTGAYACDTRINYQLLFWERE